MPSWNQGDQRGRYTRRNVMRQDGTNRREHLNPALWESFKVARPDHARWIESNADSFDFALSMRNAVMRFADLTENQLAAVERGMARDQERAQRANAGRQTPSASFPNIRAAFDALMAGGHRGGGRGGMLTAGEITLSLAKDNSTNPGAVYIKVNGIYSGKIGTDGIFRPSRDAAPGLEEALAVIDRDPSGAVRAEAARTAARLAEAQAAGRPISLPCGCCGLTLTDPVSVARGIGPICAGRWGF